MKHASLEHCLELLNEALALTQRLSGHIQDLKVYWDDRERAQEKQAA